jgi:hypothetical protein
MFDIGSKGRHRSFIVFLLLLLLLSTLVAVSHHHENTADDHGCPICIAGNHQTANGPVITAFDVTPCLTETTVVISVPAFIEHLFVASRSTRGPPA